MEQEGEAQFVSHSGRAFRLRIYPGRRFGVVIWGHVVTGDDVAEAVDALFGSPHWEPGFAHLWDGRAMENFNLDLGGAYRTGARMKELNARIGMGKAAIVVFRDFHVIGVQLIVSLGNVEDRDIKYFPDIEAAMQWLDLPLELVEF